MLSLLVMIPQLSFIFPFRDTSLFVVCFYNPTYPTWRPRAQFYVCPTYTLSSLALKTVTHRWGIKTHFPYPCSPSSCRFGQAPRSMPIDLGNLVFFVFMSLVNVFFFLRSVQFQLPTSYLDYNFFFQSNIALQCVRLIQIYLNLKEMFQIWKF